MNVPQPWQHAIDLWSDLRSMETRMNADQRAAATKILSSMFEELRPPVKFNPKFVESSILQELPAPIAYELIRSGMDPSPVLATMRLLSDTASRGNPGGLA